MSCCKAVLCASLLAVALAVPAPADQAPQPDGRLEYAVGADLARDVPESVRFFSVGAQANYVRTARQTHLRYGEGPAVKHLNAFVREVGPLDPPVSQRGTAYIVSGWNKETGVFAPKSPDDPTEANVYRWLLARGYKVKLCWWNSLTPSGFETPGPLPDPFDDSEFVAGLSKEILSTPADREVVLIGHSFGGDALIAVANRVARAKVPHRICFLGVVDATGTFGMRSVARRRSIPDIVDVFWNRCQQASPLPFDFFHSGSFRIASTARTRDDQERLRNIHGFDAHTEIAEGKVIQRDLISFMEKELAPAR